MIQKLANYTANCLISNEQSNLVGEVLSKRKGVNSNNFSKKDAIDTIAYSLQAIYSDILKMIILLILASIIHVIVPTMLIMIIFSLYRTLAGGVHMRTFSKCLIITIFSFLLGGVVLQKVYVYSNPTLNLILIVITLIYNLLIISKYVPKENENKPIKENDKMKYKEFSIYYIILSCTVMFVFYNNSLIVLSIIYGIMLEVLTFVPAGVKFFEFIDKILSRGNK